MNFQDHFKQQMQERGKAVDEVRTQSFAPVTVDLTAKHAGGLAAVGRHATADAVLAEEQILLSDLEDAATEADDAAYPLQANTDLLEGEPGVLLVGPYQVEDSAEPKAKRKKK